MSEKCANIHFYMSICEVFKHYMETDEHHVDPGPSCKSPH